MRRLSRQAVLLAGAALLQAGQLGATRFPLPPEGDDLIGEIQLEKASSSETLLDMARRHDVGQEEIRLANSGLDRWLPVEGEPVVIPSRYILPDARREGLVLNLPEMRLYHFTVATGKAPPMVDTYPVSIGRMDWKTPLGETRIISKQRDPSWHPPESVRQEAAAAGDTLPKRVPPGPDNPLGRFALRLGQPGYLIHGTNKPYGVGMRVTHGCIRLLPEDIEALFEQVPTGTRVQIVNQPVKTGWHQGVLHIEVHPPLDEDAAARDDLLRFSLEQVYAELARRPAVLDAAALRQAIEGAHGVPVAISRPGLPGRRIDSPVFR
jgi:L,D-transpeptidase ErfK/SrfK